MCRGSSYLLAPGGLPPAKLAIKRVRQYDDPAGVSGSIRDDDHSSATHVRLYTTAYGASSRRRLIDFDVLARRSVGCTCAFREGAIALGVMAKVLTAPAAGCMLQ